MPREYRHIKQYEKEILELRNKGLTYREIGKKLGFEQIKVKMFFERYHKEKQNFILGKKYLLNSKMFPQVVLYNRNRQDCRNQMMLN